MILPGWRVREATLLRSIDSGWRSFGLFSFFDFFVLILSECPHGQWFLMFARNTPLFYL